MTLLSWLLEFVIPTSEDDEDRDDEEHVTEMMRKVCNEQ